jgi:hypothetical protein
MATATAEERQTPPAGSYQKAPPGFSRQQWEFFEREGYLLLEEAISPADVRRYIDATDRIAADHLRDRPGKAFTPWNGIAHLDPVFAELIDHPRHVGFAYDVYGELLKLHNSQAFIRPKGKSETKWHNDGARAVPYSVYAPGLPLQLKVAYWLTDLPHPQMGNLVIYPRSHRSQRFDAYTRPGPLDGELPVCVKAGTMMLIHCNLFHRVMDNDTEATRYNLFYTYCPSWVCEADRLSCDEAWLKTLTREQRIIMRSYQHPYDRTKPPADDFPLYLDRDSGLDHDSDADLDVPLSIRKRRVKAEEWTE